MQEKKNLKGSHTNLNNTRYIQKAKFYFSKMQRAPEKYSKSNIFLNSNAF